MSDGSMTTKLCSYICQYHENKLTRQELEDRISELVTGTGVVADDIRRRAKGLLLNEDAGATMVRKVEMTDSAERRRLLLHSLGMTPAISQRVGLKVFKVQGRRDTSPSTTMPKIQDVRDAVVAAAFVAAPISTFLVGGRIPAPNEEPLWYHFVDMVDDTKDTFCPPNYYTDYFQFGRVTLDDQEIGVTSLWLKNRYTEISFVVDEAVPDIGRWEYRLIKFGAMRKLMGPSIYIASQMSLHAAHHRIYRMIWPYRTQQMWQHAEERKLKPNVTLLLYTRMFTEHTSEVCYFRGMPKESPFTIKYPKDRKSEVIDALHHIGIHESDSAKKLYS